MFLTLDEAQSVVGFISAIVSLAVVAIPSLISAFVFIRKVIKNKEWTTITSVADTAMKTVEEYYKTHTDMTSDAKLEMALETIQSSLKAMNIDFSDETKEKVKSYINSCINWSNSMKD